MVCVGYRGRHAILTAATIEFSELHSVGVQDLLLAVNGVSTALLSVEELETILSSDLESFEVVRKVDFEAARASSQIQLKEQLSLNRHGFYAKGNYYC